MTIWCLETERRNKKRVKLQTLSRGLGRKMCIFETQLFGNLSGTIDWLTKLLVRV